MDKFSSVIVLILLSINISYSQTVNRIDAMKGDSLYMSLINSENKLILAQDSLQNLINSKRSVLANDGVDKDKLSGEILELEGKMFDVRNELGIVATQTNIMEQEYLLTNMNESNGSRGVVTDLANKNILKNKFFKDNISKEDIKIMESSQSFDKEFEKIFPTTKERYTDLKSVSDSFRSSSEKSVADSLRDAANSLVDAIANAQSGFAQEWNNVYGLKIDTYNMLLDKINTPQSIIESLAEKSRNQRSEESVAADKYAAPIFSMYPRQKILIAEYERVLAEQLSLKDAKDSIVTAVKKIVPNAYDMAIIELPDWTFVDFQNIEIGGSKTHAIDANPIEGLVIPSRGEVYKIELATYAKQPTSYTVFRKIYPISYVELPDGQFRYYAGTYKTETDAKKDLDRLKRLGMKVKMASWKDGVLLTADGITGDVKGVFRVDITEINDDIVKKSRETAPDKELIKSSIDNQTIYSIGVFESRDDAQRVVDYIGAGKVVPVKVQ